MNWVLLPFRRFADIGGRSRRMEFWIFWLTALAVQMFASYIDAITSQTVVVGGMGPFALITTLFFLVPAATVGIRRLHDIDRTGWWMLLFGLPYLGWLVSVQAGGQSVIAAFALLLGSVILLILLVQPSAAGENSFGANPKGRIADAKPSD